MYIQKRKPVRKLQRARTQAVRQEKARLQTINLLKGIALLTLAAGAFAAPNIIQLVAYFNLDGSRDRRRLYQKISQMKRSGFISGNDSFLLTEKGERILNEEKIWNLEPDPPKRWDGVWHMVAFDIPMKYEKARHALRARLRELGFFRYQNSLYVHWVDVRLLVSAFAEFYGVAPYIKYFAVSALDDSDKVVAHCKPPRS